MSEAWKDIHFWENGIKYDYCGLYQISSFGRVKSLKYGKEKILKAGNICGYECVNLWKDSKGKNFLIHRLVAHTFLSESYFENAQVNHKDENKTNNHVSNLEWCTREYNMNFGTRSERASESMKGKNKGKYNGENNPRARKVVSVDPFTKQIVFIWRYKQQVTKFYSIGGSTLDAYLKGERKTGHLYNGFLFYYLDEWEQLNK